MTKILIDSPLAIAAACIMAAVGAEVFLMLPVIIGIAIEDLNFTEETAGLLASSYFAGYMLVSASAFFWIRRVAWRKLAVSSYFTLAAALACAGITDHFWLLVSLFFLAGCGAGTLFSLSVTILSDTTCKGRNFGYMLMAQQLLAAALLFSLPGLVIEPWGFKGLHLALALIPAIFIVTSIWLPNNDLTAADSSNIDQQTTAIGNNRVWYGLVAMTVYFASISGVWAFVERLADSNGLTATEVASALAIAMLVGILGGLSAVVLGDKWGRTYPILLSTLLFLGVFTLLGSGFGLSGFTIASLLLLWSWNFVLAYQMGIISNLDTSGRCSALMSASQALGAMIGPAVAGVMVSGSNFNSLLWAAAVGLTVSLIPFISLDSNTRVQEFVTSE